MTTDPTPATPATPATSSPTSKPPVAPTPSLPAGLSNTPLDVLQRPLGFIERRGRAWVWGVLAAVLLANLAAINGHWWIGNDSALYLNIARNLAAGEGYALAGAPHTHVPPGFPVLLAGLTHLGLGNFAALNTVMALMALATAAMAWLLLRELVHRHWALLLGGFFGLSTELVGRGGEILSDVPFTLLTLTGLWLYQRRLRTGRGPAELGSLALVAACWLRMAGFPLVFGAAVGFALSAWRTQRRRGLLNLALVGMGLAVTLGIFAWWYANKADPLAASYATQVQRIGGRSVWTALLEPLSSFYESGGQLSRLLTAQRMPLAVCLLALVLPALAAMLRRVRHGDWAGPLATACYVGALTLVLWQIRSRYLLPLLPLLTLYVLEGYALLAARLSRSARAATATVLTLLTVMAAMNLPLVLRHIVYKHQGNFLASQQDGQYAGHLAVAAWLNDQPPGRLLSDQPLAFLSGRESPMLASSLRRSSPEAEAMDRLLEQLEVRYVVIDVEEMREDRVKLPFFPALREHLGQPVFTSGELEVFEVR